MELVLMGKGTGTVLPNQSDGNPINHFVAYCDCIPKPKRDKDYPDCCSKCGGLYRGV